MVQAVTRYGFNIRTRSGQRVDNISIVARDRDDAERRLRQMYQRCEIIDCSARPAAGRVPGSGSGAAGPDDRGADGRGGSAHEPGTH